MSVFGTTFVPNLDIYVTKEHCLLYDYLIMKEISDNIYGADADKKISYYKDKYESLPERNGKDRTKVNTDSGLDDFKSTFLGKNENKKLKVFVQKPQQLLILPVFFGERIETFDGFLNRDEITKEISTGSRYYDDIKNIDMETGNNGDQFQTFQTPPDTRSTAYHGITSRKIYYLPCLLRSTDGYVGDSKYNEMLEDSIQDLHQFIKKTYNEAISTARYTQEVYKYIRLFFNANDTLSLGFYNKKSVSKPSIEYLNKNIMKLLKNMKYEKNEQKLSINDKVHVTQMYEMKLRDYFKLIDKDKDKNSSQSENRKFLTFIAREIYSWKFPPGTGLEPKYDIIDTDKLTIKYNYQLKRDDFSFDMKADGKTLYSFFSKHHQTKSSNFRVETRGQRRDNSTTNGLVMTPNNFYKLKLDDTLYKRFKKEFISETDNSTTTKIDLYIKLDSNSFMNVKKGSIYKKEGREYIKISSGVIKLSQDTPDKDKEVELLNLFRGGERGKKTIYYFKKFIIRFESFKAYLASKNINIEHDALRLKLVEALYSREKIDEYYTFCYSHPKFSGDIKKDEDENRAIKHILDVIFEKGAPFYIVKSSSSDDNSNAIARTGKYNKYKVLSYESDGNIENDVAKVTLKIGETKKGDNSEKLKNCATRRKYVKNGLGGLAKKIGQNITFKLRRFI